MSEQNIGIFSGSFNPIHVGHLMLANYLCEFENLDEIWFLVTPQSPMKEKITNYTDIRRLSWVKKAIKDYPHFKASDFEWHLPKPYYTVNTLQALKTTYPDKNFSLIIGADNWHIFHRWKDSDVILRDFSILVYPRKGYETTCNENIYPTVKFTDAPLIEVSSTFIRENIRNGKNLSFFLPDGVYQELKNED